MQGRRVAPQTTVQACRATTCRGAGARRIFALAKQLCTVKMSHKSQMNPEKLLYNTSLLAQLYRVQPVSPYNIWFSFKKGVYIFENYSSPGSDFRCSRGKKIGKEIFIKVVYFSQKNIDFPNLANKTLKKWYRSAQTYLTSGGKNDFQNGGKDFSRKYIPLFYLVFF